MFQLSGCYCGCREGACGFEDAIHATSLFLAPRRLRGSCSRRVAVRNRFVGRPGYIWYPANFEGPTKGHLRFM